MSEHQAQANVTPILTNVVGRGPTGPTLAEFVLARITEDEAYLDHGVNGPARSGVNGLAWSYDGIEGGAWRVLRECEAKRRIVTDFDQAEQLLLEPGAQFTFEEWARANGATAAHRSAVQALAAVYADHPDYQPEWA